MNETLLQIIAFAGLFIVSINFFWEAYSPKFHHNEFKYKDGRPVLHEHIFDIWVFSGIVSLFLARLSYIIFNVSHFALKWGFTPWVRNSQGKLVWLSRFPWVLINFTNGMDLAVFILSMFVVSIIITNSIKFETSVWFKPLERALLGLIIGLQVLALLFVTQGLSGHTVFEGGAFINHLTDNFYFLIGVGLSIAYVLAINFYFSRVKNLNFQILVFGLYVSLILLLVKLNQPYDTNFVYLSLLPVAIGLLYFAFGKNTKSESDLLNELDKLKDGKRLSGVQLNVKGGRKNKKRSEK